MPSVSQRSLNAYASPIRKLSPFADKAKRAGKHIYHLNIGQPDILTPQAAIQRLQQTPIDILAYTPSKGMPSFRQKIPSYYAKHGIKLTQEDIIVTTGASEAIFFALLACLDEGDEVIIPEPFYANYIGFAELAKAKVVPITAYIQDGFALPSVADFEAKITAKTKAILICNPSNPTGCLYSEKDLYELTSIVKKHDMYLIVDEVYREFCYDDQVFFSSLRLKEIEENVLVIDSISKRYSACGARVGMIVTRNQALINTITQYVEIRLSTPSYGQILAEYLLDTPDSYLDDVKAEYVARRDVLYSRLSKMKGVISYRPSGAFYCFVELPIDDCDRFCRWLLEDFSHNNSSIMLAPGSGFYFTEGLGKKEVRIAYVLNINDLEKAMDCLEVALEEYKM